MNKFRYLSIFKNLAVTAPRITKSSSVVALSTRQTCASRLYPLRLTRNFSFTSTKLNMSDADYAAFLDKANKSYSTPSNTTTAKSTEGISSRAPPSIRNLGERYYTSDTDEPFTDVEMDYDNTSFPSAESFGTLVKASQVDLISTKEWDPRNDYKDVVDAVKKAVDDNEVGIFKVSEGTRITYYVLGLGKGKLVGVKVNAVES